MFLVRSTIGLLLAAQLLWAIPATATAGALDDRALPSPADVPLLEECDSEVEDEVRRADHHRAALTSRSVLVVTPTASRAVGEPTVRPAIPPALCRNLAPRAPPIS